MFVLGLTGSIGMGKSATAKLFRRFNIPVHDADATVHRLMEKGGAATKLIERAFPGSIDNEGAVDRQKLGALVFNNPSALRKLEAILHPMVRKAENRFLRQNRLQRKKIVVLDIPLLFETKGEKRCDAVAVVTASKVLQKKRVMARAGMNAEKFKAILKKQMPDAQKRQKADFIIFTGSGFRFAHDQVKNIVDQISG